MAKMYTDYTNKIAIAIPEKFIDIKSGETQPVSETIIKQIEYHTANNTLNHLIFSALHHYLQHKAVNADSLSEILVELAQIKKALQQGNMNATKGRIETAASERQKEALNLKELEDMLEAFGG